MNKLKILISAYACEPNKGSEPGVGWNWVKQIARFHEVWVITRANNMRNIEKELSREPNDNIHFVYYEIPKWASFWKKGRKGYRFYYFLWQIGIYKIVKRLHREIHFDLVHHLTFGNILFPTFLSLLPVQFIWGPLGGGEIVPKLFRKGFAVQSRLKEEVRHIILNLLNLNPLFLFNCYRAKLIITKTVDTKKKIPEIFINKVVTLLDVGSSNYTNIKKKINGDRGVQIISVGTLEPWRGFHLLLSAFAQAIRKFNNLKLVIIGDGIDKERLEGICRDKHLKNNVEIKGVVSRETYLELLFESSFLINPCLREGGATVVLDALSIGLPVICMDISGSSEVVDNKVGIKVKLTTIEKTINDLSEAILKLANEPAMRMKMGEAGKKKVEEEFSWDKKGNKIREFYNTILSEDSFHF